MNFLLSYVYCCFKQWRALFKFEPHLNDYYPRLICKIDKVCIRLRIIIAFKTTITIPVLKSLFLFGKLAPPLYLYLHFYPANPPPPSRECVVKRPKLAPPAPGRIPPRQDTPPMVKKETRCNITRFVYNTFSRELSASHEYLTTKAVGLSFYNQGEDSVCFEFLMISNQFTHTRLLGVLTPNLGRNHSLSSPNLEQHV